MWIVTRDDVTRTPLSADAQELFSVDCNREPCKRDSSSVDAQELLKVNCTQNTAKKIPRSTVTRWGVGL